jgi:hypothetical protein
MVFMSLFLKNSKFFIIGISIIINANFIFANGIFLVGSEISDTVKVKPLKISTIDSIYFSLFDAAHCSCTKYYNKNVSVSDSTITLFAQFDEKDCNLKECLKTGSSTEFSCGPIHAGVYKIFKTEDIYCPPGQPCPLVVTQDNKEFVGELTVTNDYLGKQIENGPGNAKSVHSVLSYSSAGKMLTLRITKAQFVQVTAYVINGEKTKEFSSKKFLPAGIHPFRMNFDRFSSGVVVIHVKGENFSEVQMINLAK